MYKNAPSESEADKKVGEVKDIFTTIAEWYQKIFQGLLDFFNMIKNAMNKSEDENA